MSIYPFNRHVYTTYTIGLPTYQLNRYAYLPTYLCLNIHSIFFFLCFLFLKKCEDPFLQSPSCHLHPVPVGVCSIEIGAFASIHRSLWCAFKCRGMIFHLKISCSSSSRRFTHTYDTIRLVCGRAKIIVRERSWGCVCEREREGAFVRLCDECIWGCECVLQRVWMRKL